MKYFDLNSLVAFVLTLFATNFCQPLSYLSLLFEKREEIKILKFSSDGVDDKKVTHLTCFYVCVDSISASDIKFFIIIMCTITRSRGVFESFSSSSCPLSLSRSLACSFRIPKRIFDKMKFYFISRCIVCTLIIKIMLMNYYLFLCCFHLLVSNKIEIYVKVGKGEKWVRNPPC